MSRNRKERYSPYQLPLELERIHQEPVASYRALIEGLAGSDTEQSRFVRQVKEGIVVRLPRDAAQHLLEKVYTPFERIDQEEFWVLLLNVRNRITHEVMVYRGTVDTIRVRPAEVFKEAVRTNAASILLSHCHPSGEPNPSPEDVKLTEQLLRAAEILDITVLDHIVVGRAAWFSLREKGLAFTQPK